MPDPAKMPIASLNQSSIASLVLTLLILAGCSFGASTPIPVAEIQTSQPIPTTTVSAAADDASQATATAIAVAALANVKNVESGQPASYSGNVIAEEVIDVAVEVSGQVLQLYVQVGDSVHTGDILLEVDKTTLEAQRAQALAGLEVVQAQLDLLLEAPEQSDLDAAHAVVTAAEAAYQRALDGPTAEDLRAADAQVRQADAAVAQAQSAYDLVKGSPNIGALPQSLQLQQATLQAEVAHAQYDKLVKGSTADIIAGAYGQLSQAQAQLHNLEEGAKEGQIRAAQAQVHQAETALYLAQLQLDKATVRAPIDGAVLAVNTAIGAQAAPGAPVIQLQTNTVKVEIAVEEVRLPEIRVGQPAQIGVNAYPNRLFAGEIAIIAPALDPATRTVQVTIRPTDDATDLRPGMFATVNLLP